jgi:hypothetical protein
LTTLPSMQRRIRLRVLVFFKYEPSEHMQKLGGETRGKKGGERMGGGERGGVRVWRERLGA